MYFLSLALIVVLTAVDQIIKILVDKHIALNEVINVIKFGDTKIFSLTHIRNTGAAWSMMSGKTWFLICLPVVVCVFALIYMYKIRKTKKLEMFSISLFVAGGIGNLIDRIRLHEVIDYILFEPVDFPIFNFADICVVVGVILFAAAMIFEEKKDKKEEKPVKNE